MRLPCANFSPVLGEWEYATILRWRVGAARRSLWTSLEIGKPLARGWSLSYCVIPKSRAFTSGTRDLACGANPLKTQCGAREIPHSAGENAEFRDDDSK
jgi:hypothetical protein